jgi:IS1 family transposase
MANILSKDKQRDVIRLLVEGNSIRSIERITGVHRDTIMRLSIRFGNACRQFLDEEMRGLTLNHIQVDEIWTFVGKKQARLHIDERDNPGIGDMYLWVALDQETKLVPTFSIGKRSADMARRLMMDLAARLVFPKPHDSDDHAYRKGTYQQITQVSTDGFKGYPEAVDLAFGPYVKFGTIEKDYRNADRQPGNYSPAQIAGTIRKARFGMREDEARTICTSHVERNNLTIRTFIKRFARLALGFSKKRENLAAATAIHFAYYNFCWRSRHTDYSGMAGRLRATPAMAAGVTERLWKFDDLFSEVSARYLSS